MNTHKGCPDRSEAIAALAMGILPAHEAAALHKHLDSCDNCRTFYNTLARQEAHLHTCFDQLAESAQSPADAVPGCHGPARRRLACPLLVLNAAEGAGSVSPDAGCHGPEDAAPLAADQGHAPPTTRGIVPTQPQRRRRIIRAVASHPRLAIAAIVLAAAIGLFTLSWHTGKDPLANPAEAAYSDMLRQIARARSVCFTQSALDDGQDTPLVFKRMFLEGGWMRGECGSDFITIENFITGDELYLDPTRKTARPRHMLRADRQQLSNYLDWIQSLHEHNAVYIGRECLDGVPVDVYLVEQPYEKITVWADVRTNLPVRLVKRVTPCTDKDIRVPDMELGPDDFLLPGEELYTGGEGGRYVVHDPGICENATTITLSDFAWNIDLDESLFSLKPPRSYTVASKMDYGETIGGAQALVEALQFWAEMSAGRFPDNINMLSDARPLLIRRYLGTDEANEAYQEAIKVMHTIASGMFFAQQLKLDDNWHYAGKTVRLGQADSPLAWWLDKKTGLWRVLYGDLHTADLPPDQKPADPAGAPGRGPQ